MLIPHDTRFALDTVVDLVNTLPQDDANGGDPDGLACVEALYAFLRRHRVSDVGELGSRDLGAVLEVRARFAEVFAAPAPPVAAALINELVAAAGTTPQLTDHDGYDWHVHYFAPGASVADHLAADCGMALAFILVAGEQERLLRCEAPDCGRAFVDLSRNRSRRYCDSRTCGNRLHVAAYRARRREAAGALTLTGGTDRAPLPGAAGRRSPSGRSSGAAGRARKDSRAAPRWVRGFDPVMYRASRSDDDAAATPLMTKTLIRAVLDRYSVRTGPGTGRVRSHAVLLSGQIPCFLRIASTSLKSSPLLDDPRGAGAAEEAGAGRSVFARETGSAAGLAPVDSEGARRRGRHRLAPSGLLRRPALLARAAGTPLDGPGRHEQQPRDGRGRRSPPRRSG